MHSPASIMYLPVMRLRKKRRIRGFRRQRNKAFGLGRRGTRLKQQRDGQTGVWKPGKTRQEVRPESLKHSSPKQKPRAISHRPGFCRNFILASQLVPAMAYAIVLSNSFMLMFCPSSLAPSLNKTSMRVLLCTLVITPMPNERCRIARTSV